MVVFAGVAVVHRFQYVSEANERRDTAQSLVDAAALVELIESERGRTVQAAVEVSPDSLAARDAARSTTDAALPLFNEAVDRLGVENGATFAEVRTALGELAELRAGIDAGSLSVDEASTRYSSLVDGLLIANGTVVQELGFSGHMAHDAAALDAVARIAETVAFERDLMTPALVRGGFDGDEYERQVAIVARRAELARQFRQLLAADEDVVALDQTLQEMTTPLVIDTRAVADQNGRFGTDPLAWYDDMTALRDGIDGISGEISHHLMDDLDELASAASTQRTFYLFVAFLSVTGMAGAFLAMNQLIRRPLAHLVEEINETARVRLPEAVAAALDANAEPYELYRISGAGGRELEELAEAFNEAQLQVVALASDQATIRRNVGEIFANLGRRNQKLIARQLSFIDRLEKREQDPEILENLFRLDHLATRMRRNAESLLVLAGTETPRTWSAPVNVGDAVRAAVAEVEQYERAEIRSMAPAKLRGNIASNVSHLLAELIENGLNFSPPDSVVVISGRLRTDSYVISVIDSGIGIEVEERATLNHRLASAGAADVAPSRYLGLFVVSRLAARYGIEVELLEGESGGTHARVTLPLELLVVSDKSDTPDTPDKPGKPGKSDTPDKSDRPRQSDRPEKPELRQEREQPAGPDRSDGALKAGTADIADAGRGSNGAVGPDARQAEPDVRQAEPAPAPVTPRDAAKPADGSSSAGNGSGPARQDRPNRGGGGRSTSSVSRSGVGGTPNRDDAQQGSIGSGADNGPGPSEISTSSEEGAGGSKLRTRPKRDKQNGPPGNATPARRNDVSSKATPQQQKNQTTTSGGGRPHDQPQEPEVMSSGLRRRAPKKSLEDGQPDAGAERDERDAQPAGPAPKRNAADVQNMLSSFRAAQNRAVQRTNPSDTNDDEVTA
ncbi:MAG: nitrate- and nitrite sensing domain-containing protein [Acidimicrobiales bacterium]|nr:nitrate- and nitrite sensing domain-containing protein [Acidimicrobiales bacterium]